MIYAPASRPQGCACQRALHPPIRGPTSGGGDCFLGAAYPGCPSGGSRSPALHRHVRTSACPVNPHGEFHVPHEEPLAVTAPRTHAGRAELVVVTACRSPYGDRVDGPCTRAATHRKSFT